ncbi:MAG: hypothetical protein HC913_23650, partial [Microscillaceae bacterium]|nr:hypothetical protein [Microscillaceae bacterium]
ARAVHYQPEPQRLVFDSVEGGTVSKFSQLRIYWHGWTLDELAENLFLAETKLEVATEDYRFVEPISNFDPWEHNEDQSKTIFALPFVEIDWVSTSFEIAVPH